MSAAAWALARRARSYLLGTATEPVTVDELTRIIDGAPRAAGMAAWFMAHAGLVQLDPESQSDLIRVLCYLDEVDPRLRWRADVMSAWSRWAEGRADLSKFPAEAETEAAAAGDFALAAEAAALRAMWSDDPVPDLVRAFRHLSMQPASEASLLVDLVAARMLRREGHAQAAVERLVAVRAAAPALWSVWIDLEWALMTGQAESAETPAGAVGALLAAARAGDDAALQAAGRGAEERMSRDRYGWYEDIAALHALLNTDGRVYPDKVVESWQRGESNKLPYGLGAVVRPGHPPAIVFVEPKFGGRRMLGEAAVSGASFSADAEVLRLVGLLAMRVRMPLSDVSEALEQENNPEARVELVERTRAALGSQGQLDEWSDKISIEVNEAIVMPDPWCLAHLTTLPPLPVACANLVQAPPIEDWVQAPPESTAPEPDPAEALDVHHALIAECMREGGRDSDAILALIADGADLNRLHNLGPPMSLTPLMGLVQQRRPDPELEVVELMLVAGADPNAATPRGDSALHIAAAHNLPEIVRLLLHHGAAPDSDSSGFYRGTPMLRAIDVHGDAAVQIIETLLAAGANPNATAGGTHAVENAIGEGAWEVVRMLVDAGGVLDRAPDPGGSAFATVGAIAIAVRPIRSEQQPPEDRLKWLIDLGANVDHQDVRGRTALFLGAVSMVAELAGRLVRLGANIDHRDHAGKTPLIAAVEAERDPSALQPILTAGADVNACDHQGRSSLFYAVHHAQEAIVRFLMDNGATPQPSVHKLAVEKGLSPVLVALGVPAEVEGTYLERAMALLKSGRALMAGEERLEKGWIRDGKQVFQHQHPAYSGREKHRYREEPWVEERLAWLMLHRGEALSGLIGAVNVDVLEAELMQKRPDLHRRASLDLSGANLGEVLVAGLWAGASFCTNNSGGGESWDRDGEVIAHEWHDFGPVHRSEYTREDAAKGFASWGTIADGLVAPGYSFPSALDAALRALGADTLRGWLLSCDDSGSCTSV